MKQQKITWKTVGGYLQVLVGPNRVFIREGTLQKVCRKTNKPRRFFLFSDCLVYAKIADTTIESSPTCTFDRMVLLLHTKVTPASENQERAFQVLGKEKSFTVICKTAEEKDSWLKSISDAIAAQGEQEDIGGQAPVWIPDSNAEKCMICGTKFTVVNRRHHCRRCGKVVCGKCSSCEFMMVNTRTLERVCNMCFDALVEMNGGWSMMEGRTKLYRVPKTVLAASRVFIPPDQWNERHIREWTESVSNGKFAQLKESPRLPKFGVPFVRMSQYDVDRLFEESSLKAADNAELLKHEFFDLLVELRRRVYLGPPPPPPQVTVIDKQGEAKAERDVSPKE